jgi:hypothetical protein
MVSAIGTEILTIKEGSDYVEGGDMNDLSACCRKKDSGLQSWRIVAILSCGHRPLDQAVVERWSGRRQ